MYETFLFQFYDSPIKSERQLPFVSLHTWFQFYDSPIKSILLSHAKQVRTRFQFYDSPIKSIFEGRLFAAIHE